MRRSLFLSLLLCLCGPLCAQEEVALDCPWGTLRGTLLAPEGEKGEKGEDENGGKTAGTVVLLIAGSGPTDRNGDGQGGLSTRCYALLAEALQSGGFASLRYDKRGIGGSYCRDREAFLADCRFTYFVDDALLWAEWLREERGFSRVVLAGHSEGSLIALLAAARAPEKVDAVVSLCGAAWPMDEILKVQLMNQLAGYDMGLLLTANRIIDTLKRGGTPENIPAQLAALFPAYLNDFYHEQMNCDPQRLAAGLKCPLLVAGGMHDVQVPPDNARALHRARPGSQLVLVEGMTHTLKRSEGTTPADQAAAYTDPALPLAAGLTAPILEFLKEGERVVDSE